MKILCAGDNTIDVYDGKTFFPGGNCVNVAVHLKRLGNDSSYLGTVATNRYGQHIRMALEQEQVDLRYLTEVEGVHAESRVKHVDGERIFLSSQHGVSGQIDYSPLESTKDTFDLIHSSLYSHIDLSRLRSRTRFLSYDFSDDFTPAIIEKLKSTVDIAFFSMEQAGAKAFLVRYQNYFQVLVLTFGADGCLVINDGKAYRGHSESINVVDTMGAGDAFIASFLTLYLKETNMELVISKSIRYATDNCLLKGSFGYEEVY